MLDTGVHLLTLAISILYLWVGALKLIPGASPLEPLISDSYAFLDSWGIPLRAFIAFVGLFEMLIGLGMLVGKKLRVFVVLLWLQLCGTFSPMVLAPERVWKSFPWLWTLEGQYILKDLLLIASGVVIWGWVREREY